VLVAVVALCLVATPAPARADLRISNLTVFLNDLDVTVHVVLVGAIPASLHEGLHSGIAAHVRYTVELWQYNRHWIDRRIESRTTERQLTYNVLTKEYKAVFPAGEQREPYLSKSLREAQRVISDLRVTRLVPASALDPRALYYVRVRAESALGGANTWAARVAGDAEETPWMQSSLLTLERSQ
jgi:hypothetical protein